MVSESREFITPTRTGRMTGVNVSIDGETWEYVLTNMGLPANTPPANIQIKRYRTRDGRIILKLKLKIPANPEPAQMPAISAFVTVTSETDGE